MQQLEWLAQSWYAAQPNAAHAAAWRWIDEHREAYPSRFIAPLRPRKPSARRRAFVGAVLDTRPGVDELAAPIPVQLRLYDERGAQTVQLAGTERDAELIAKTLFTHTRRGRIVGFGNGARLELHVILRHYAPALTELGYRLKPLVTGTDVRALIVSKDRHAWYLGDLRTVTGLGDLEPAGAMALLRGEITSELYGPSDVYFALEALQTHLMSIWSVTAKLTLGMSALQAALHHLPDDAWVWRPCPGLVALCRAGRGYRGGYVWAAEYRGELHRADITRAYTWAMSLPLPSRYALSREAGAYGAPPGIYMCTVDGPGTQPVYLGVWEGYPRGFVNRLWNGDECVCVLPSDEWEGLRALGYRVTPCSGFVATDWTDLSGFTDGLAAVITEHGSQSAPGMIAKLMGNAVYGKLAERSERQELIYSATEPGRKWEPFVDTAGEELDGVWVRTTTSHRAHQHVDLAAAIAARVRSRLYDGIARLSASGVRVVSADTDGLFCAADPRAVLGAAATAPGQWRYEGVDPDGVVAGPRMYAWRARVAIAGTWQQARQVIEIIRDGGHVEVAGRVMAPPWSDGAMYREVRRRLRAPPAAAG